MNHDQLGYERAAEQFAEQQRVEASRAGLYLTLVSIAMFFAALTVVYLLRGPGDDSWAGIPIPSMVWVSTAVLVASSLLLHRQRRRLGIRLGWAFLVAQTVAWWQIIAVKGPGSWFFWTFSVLHALHVVGGLAAFYLARFELARTYWHFVTGLWLYVMTLFIALRLLS